MTDEYEIQKTSKLVKIRSQVKIKHEKEIISNKKIKSEATKFYYFFYIAYLRILMASSSPESFLARMIFHFSKCFFPYVSPKNSQKISRGS